MSTAPIKQMPMDEGDNKGFFSRPWVMFFDQVDQSVTISSTPSFGVISMTVIKSGATQALAEAEENELWKTDGHATLPDNLILIGV